MNAGDMPWVAAFGMIEQSNLQAIELSLCLKVDHFLQVIPYGFPFALAYFAKDSSYGWDHGPIYFRNCGLERSKKKKKNFGRYYSRHYNTY